MSHKKTNSAGKIFTDVIFPCLLFSTISLGGYASELPYFTGGVESGTQTPLNAGIWWPTTNNNSHYFFTDIDGNYSANNNNGSIELGADYRKLLSNDWALGAYGFAAYNRSPSDQSFFTLNPGIELLNRAWHFNWNLYLPISATKQGSGDWVWADSVGIYNYTHFQAHTQYNQLVQIASTTGTGTDLIASYRFKKLANIQASAGIYYFNMDPHDLGYVAMLTSPTVKHTSVNLAFSHDSLTNNSVVIGLTLHFGNTQSQDTHWINSAVQHNLPSIAGANTIPIKTGYYASGQDQVQNDNVWFFNTTGTPYNNSNGIQNCTYEHPCSGLNNSNLLNIALTTQNAGFAEKPSIYLAPGNYTSPDLILYGNESLIGRTTDYTQPAMDNNRPLLTTAQLLIDASADNTINSVENLRFMNNGFGYSAIDLVGTEQTTLNNLMIGVSNSAVPSENYVSGLFLNHPNNVTLNNSSIITDNDLSGSALDIVGIGDQGATNLLIENSNISNFITNASNIIAEDLYVSANSKITIKNSSFDAEGNGNSIAGINVYDMPGVSSILQIENSHFNADINSNNGSVNNFTLFGNSTATVNNATFNASIISTATNQNSMNIQLYNNAELTMNNSSMTATGESTSGQSAATNIFLFNNSQSIFNNTNLTATGSSALVTGSTNITAENDSSASVNGGQFSVSMSGAPSAGEPSGAVALWAINNATLSVNNATVTAISGNNETGAVVLQTQNNAVATVNNSLFKAMMEHGNITTSDASPVIAGDNSSIAINNSQIFATMAGATDHDLIMVESISNATIHLNNDEITANNQMTPAGINPVLTIGAGATNASTIYLNEVNFNLSGENTQNTKTWDSGKVIGN